MKALIKGNKLIITKGEEDDFTTSDQDFSDLIYKESGEKIELIGEEKLDKFNEFLINGSIEFDLSNTKVNKNKKENPLDKLKQENKELLSLVVEDDNSNSSNSNSSIEIEEEFEFEETIKPTNKVGEILTDYFNQGWYINKTKIQRGYATYITEVHFKSNGKYFVERKRIAGPKINYLESIALEMKISETGANGLPAIESFIDETEDEKRLVIVSEENLILKYQLKHKNWFINQKKKMLMFNDF